MAHGQGPDCAYLGRRVGFSQGAMAIQFLPLLSGISNLATAAFEIYQKTKRADSHRAWPERVQELERARVEQAQLISEVAKDLAELSQGIRQEMEDLEKFAHSVQLELRRAQEREKRAWRLSLASAAVAALSLAASVLLWIR